MLKNKLLCGIACIAIVSVSAMDKKNKFHGNVTSLIPVIRMPKQDLFTNKDQKKSKKESDRVVLIDENGRIPAVTLPKMSIESSTLLSQYHPKALDNCHNCNEKNEVLAIVKILHGAPEAWRKSFFEQIGLESKESQEKFIASPADKAIESYSMALRLHNGLLKKYSVDSLFGNNRNKLILLDGLSKHFAEGHTNKQVSKEVYYRMREIDKKIREEFHNNEEFYTLEVMPDLMDQVICMGTNILIGTTLGSGAGAITGFGFSSAEETVFVPAIKTFANEAIVNVGTSVAVGILSGVAHRSGINTATNAVTTILENNNNIMNCISNVVTATPQAYVKGFTNNSLIHGDLIKNQCKIKNFVPKVLEQVLHGDNSLSSVGFKKACEKAINTAQSGGLIGAFVGFCRGYYMMKKPIKEKISKL